MYLKIIILAPIPIVILVSIHDIHDLLDTTNRQEQRNPLLMLSTSLEIPVEKYSITSKRMKVHF
jgi:hypothetical protein